MKWFKQIKGKKYFALLILSSGMLSGILAFCFDYSFITAFLGTVIFLLFFIALILSIIKLAKIYDIPTSL